MVHADEVPPHTHTHTQKVELLDKLDRGMSIVIVRCHCGVNKLKIFFIKKHEDKIRRIIMASTLYPLF